MNYLAFPVYMITAITFYTGINHFFYYLLRKEDKLNIYFSFLCFSVALYQLSCAGLYSSTSMEQGIFWQRFNFSFISLISIAAYFYIKEYTQCRVNISSFTICIIFVFFLMIPFYDSTYTLTDTRPMLRSYKAFGLLNITLYEGNPGIILQLEYLAILMLFIWGISSLISTYRIKPRKDKILLIISFAIFFASSLNDYLVANAMIHSIYLTEYAFLTLIFAVTSSMSINFIRMHKKIRYLNKNLADEVKNRTMDLMAEKDNAEKASKVKSIFLANMSHEIKTPMNGIVGVVDFLKNTPLTKEQYEYVELIRKSSSTLLSLLNNLLDYSKIESGKFEEEKTEFRLSEIIDDAFNPVTMNACEKNIELIACMEPDIPDNLMGEPVKLRQVLINLMSNALKFTDHGEVVLNISIDNINEERIILLFEVRDSGPGISKKDSATIFSPFIQAEKQSARQHLGSGLGLAICTHLTRLMGGRIWVEPGSTGKGSSFKFTARFKDMEKDLPLNKNIQKNIQYRNAAILVGNENLGKAIIRGLSHSGIKTSSFLSFYAFEKFLSKEDVDIIIIDTKFDIYSDELVMMLNNYKKNRIIKVIGLCFPGKNYETRNTDCLCNASDICIYKPITPWKIDSVIKGLTTETKTEPVEIKDVRLLVVDDNEINLMVLSKILKSMGIDHDTALDGEEGLYKVQEKRYDLIFMDIQMPVMDGIELTRKIRKGDAGTASKDIPIIAVTAHAMFGDKEKYLSCGMDDYLAKPVLHDDVKRILAKFC